MTRFLSLCAAALLAACQTTAIAPPVKTTSPVEEASIVVLVSKTGQPARDLVHSVAARCWLDGVVRGAQMIVKPSGNIEIVGDQYLLVAADYIGLKGARSRWRLTGTALRDPVKRQRLVASLDEVVRSGNTACPVLQG